MLPGAKKQRQLSIGVGSNSEYSKTIIDSCSCPTFFARLSFADSVCPSYVCPDCKKRPIHYDQRDRRTRQHLASRTGPLYLARSWLIYATYKALSMCKWEKVEFWILHASIISECMGGRALDHRRDMNLSRFTQSDIKGVNLGIDDMSIICSMLLR